MTRGRQATRRSQRVMGWTTVAIGSAMVMASLGFALLATGPVPASASGPCPAASSCVSMPGGAGNIEATPTSGLANDQWVNLNFTGFQPGVKLLVYYCADTAPLSAGSPQCVLNGTANLLYPDNSVITYSTGSDIGGADIPFQVAESSSAVPFTGRGPDIPGPQKPIVCDGTAANPCAIVVVEPFLIGANQITAADTVVIPITFASATGCPNATLLPTESEYGIEQLLPVASQLTCASSSSPVLPFNTALDGEAAVSQLAAGEVPVAFTDDPEAPDQQAALKTIKDGYALIPVALSANVLGFRSVVQQSTGVGELYPKTAFNLTPTQVAGLVSALYVSPSSSDLVPCSTPSAGGWCSDPDVTDCISTACSILAEENADAGYFGAQEFAVAVRSDSSGVTHQLFQWLCNAPNVPLSLYGNPVSEPASASEVLVQGFNTNLPPGDPTYSSCPTTSDTFPSLQSAGTVYFSEVAQPFQQLVKIAGTSGLIQPTQSATISSAGFAPMNWAEAIFNGFDIASIQNNQGDFVQPTAASIDAALSDATTNPDGSLSFNYSGSGSAGSYPLPDLIYAVVAKTPQSATSAGQVSSMLSSILNLTGGAETADLPSGFVPLPTTMYNQATADLKADIVALPPSTTPGSTPTKSPTTTTTKKPSTTVTHSSTAGTGGVSSCSSCGNFFGAASSFVDRSLSTPPAPPSSSHHVTVVTHHHAPLPPVASSVLLEPTANRLLLPWLGVAGLLALLWGLLLLSPPVRRRMLAVTSARGRAARKGFVKGQPANVGPGGA